MCARPSVSRYCSGCPRPEHGVRCRRAQSPGGCILSASLTERETAARSIRERVGTERRGSILRAVLVVRHAYQESRRTKAERVSRSAGTLAPPAAVPDVRRRPAARRDWTRGLIAPDGVHHACAFPSTRAVAKTRHGVGHSIENKADGPRKARPQKASAEAALKQTARFAVGEEVILRYVELERRTTAGRPDYVGRWQGRLKRRRGKRGSLRTHMTTIDHDQSANR